MTSDKSEDLWQLNRDQANEIADAAATGDTAFRGLI